MIDLKKNIEHCISNFSKNTFTENALALFNTLGYDTSHNITLEDKSYQYFKENFVDLPENKDKFNKDKAWGKEWKTFDFLFQLTDKLSGLKGGKVNNQEINSVIFACLELTSDSYSRSQLAEITRQINKVFAIPIILLFKYNQSISLSVVHRRINKIDEQKDVLEKVTLIKDISIQSPHRAQIEILHDFAFPNLNSKKHPTSFVELTNAWEQVFNTKALNNEFYKELFKWYLWAKDHVLFPNDNQEDIDTYKSESLIRFISRLLFVWFMKEKGLITDKLFEVSELKKILKNFDTNSDKNSYYKAILQNLFFATLNVPIDDRKWIDGKKRNKAQHGDPLIYRYENEFTNSEDAIENIFMQIPFLNGGLFDCLDDRENEIFIDGFTKNEKKQPKFPNFVFFGTREDVDLSHHFGDDKDELKKWKKNSIIGIIDLLNNFKFTVEENTPLEIDVALDPELLGKVFENLLASFNPETKATARKQTGSFYTPREIVNYMVDESLKQHLKTHLPNLENEIEHLFKNEKVDLNDSAKKSIVEKLFDCKILDPACGSGAYPMGILHKMVELFNILDSQNFYLKEIEGKKLDQLIISAQHLSDTQTRNQTIDALENQKEILKKAEFDYVRKLYIIENCIYGVDIQPIAIQISKLRFFISLLVEQNKKENQKNFGIEALPNMDFKLVAANTLIAPPQEEKGIGLFENQNQFFDRFEKLAHEYFTLHSPEMKRGKKEELKKLIQEKVSEKVQMIRRDEEAHTFNGVAKSKKSEIALADLNQSKTLWESYPNLFKEKSVAFFDIPYFFPKVKDGFDVMIGNPPYVDSETMVNTGLEELRTYLNKHLQFAKGNWDLYIAFFETSFNLLNKYGNLIFITPDKWISKNFGFEIRKGLLNNFLKIVNSGRDVFESANVDSIITHLSKVTTNKLLLYKQISENKFLFQLEYPKKKIDTPYCFDWLFSDNIELIKKIECASNYLKDYSICENACATSDAYDIKDLIENEKIDFRENDEFLIMINTGTIDKYVSKWGIKEMTYLKEKFLFPIINKDEFLRKFPNSYGKKSLKPKILIKGLTLLDACIDFEGKIIPGKSTLIIIEENINKLKFLSSIVNSKLILFYFKEKYSGSSYNTGITFNKDMLNNFPVPEIPEPAQQPFIALVNQILEGKKEGKDTSHLEHQIDVMVYHLYGLSYEEACVIDGELKREDFEKYKI